MPISKFKSFSPFSCGFSLKHGEGVAASTVANREMSMLTGRDGDAERLALLLAEEGIDVNWLRILMVGRHFSQRAGKATPSV